MSRRIHVISRAGTGNGGLPSSGTGNRMFQYMFALALQQKVPDAEIHGVRLPEWGIVAPAAPPQDGPAIRLKHHSVPFQHIVKAMRTCDTIDVTLTRVHCRMEYYRDALPIFRKAFPPTAQAGGNSDELVIHVRGADILKGSHPTYMPAPLGFFDMLLRTTGLAPVFVGQVGDDWYGRALRERFPHARFVRHSNPLKDFHTLRNSLNLVPSVGSFGWLAAWLSERAETIHLPIMGLLHPGARPEIDLLPWNDTRFAFYRSSLLSWRGTPAERTRLVEAPASDFRFRRVSRIPRVLSALRHAPRSFYLTALRRRRVARQLAYIC